MQVKQCIFLLRHRNASNSYNSSRIHYCLLLKLWNEPCANKCQSFQELTGEIETLEEVESQKYDIDCLDMSRKVIQSQSRFYCKLYELPEPFCTECQFARYSTSPVVEMSLGIE